MREVVTLSGPGFEVRAARAVLALPPTALAKITFEPALGGALAQLASNCVMGHVVKAMLVYPNPFWRAQKLSGESWSGAGLIAGTYDVSPPTGQGILAALSAGEAARHLGAMPPDTRRSAVLTALARTFGPQVETPIHYVDKVWADDPWIGGGYSVHAGPGCFADGFEALRRPRGVLHFAGTETARSWPGYMEGALESAERGVAGDPRS